MASIATWTLEKITQELRNDTRVKVAGLDVDGILRGKIMSKSKFLSAVKSDGFGFCSVTFGWDMHDLTYPSSTSNISTNENGFTDITAKIDLDTFRRIPWEDDQAFFLLNFWVGDKALAPDPRSLLKNIVQDIKDSCKDAVAMAGLEYEFFNFLESPASLAAKKGSNLTHLTPGNFGYSIMRPQVFHNYFTSIFDTALKFGVPIEGWHTETGPGVYEAALEFTNVTEMADRGALFKLLVKSLGLKEGIMPCFMAKPMSGLSGNSGHIHLSLASPDGDNLFSRSSSNPNPQYPDLVDFSDLAIYFIAGVLTGLPDIMPLLAPNINSYKRLVENYWAPVDVSWGLEHRLASVRLIGPPTASRKGTRIEVRVPGADVVPHYALSALLACGLRGIKLKLALPCAPLSSTPAIDDKGHSSLKSIRLAKDLKEAVMKFERVGSIAREVLGDEFVDHLAATRKHEIRLWEEHVTEWEVKRYMEVV